MQIDIRMSPSSDLFKRSHLISWAYSDLIANSDLVGPCIYYPGGIYPGGVAIEKISHDEPKISTQEQIEQAKERLKK